MGSQFDESGREADLILPPLKSVREATLEELQLRKSMTPIPSI
jgi:hypothetical protein